MCKYACARCGGLIRIDTPEKEVNGKNYHYHCSTKLNKETQSETISRPNASTLCLLD